MARCTKCQTEWRFKDKAGIFKSLSSSVKCPYCGAEQFLNLKAQKQIGVANVMIPTVMFLPFWMPFDVPLWFHIIFIIIGIILIAVLDITLVKLSNKKEYII